MCFIVINIHRTRHQCELETQGRGTSGASHAKTASPVFTEGVAAHVTHPYQPWKHVFWLEPFKEFHVW